MPMHASESGKVLNLNDLSHFFICDQIRRQSKRINMNSENLTLLRYFDLKEVVEFISYLCEHHYINKKRLYLGRYFNDLDDIDMKNIKIYYIELLRNIQPEHWETIYNYFTEKRSPRILETFARGLAL